MLIDVETGVISKTVQLIVSPNWKLRHSQVFGNDIIVNDNLVVFQNNLKLGAPSAP